MKDYTCWGTRELIERIEELEARERTTKKHDEAIKELEKTCKHCGEPLYTVIHAHAHTEGGVDVTK